MISRRSGNANTKHGLILIDKVSGMTSHDIVSKLRRLLGIREIGHAGTLDPMATGLLVCLIGDATKLSQYVMAQDKCYRVGIKFGETTDSGDVTGKIIETKAFDHLNQNEVLEKVSSLIGLLTLPVPKYSAIKISGKKLYEYARNDEVVELPVREMTVTKVVPFEFENGEMTLDLYCAKGTYVRSWVEKLGQDLGVGATVKSLQRISSGLFSVEKAQTLDALEEMGQEWARVLIPMTEALNQWPALKLVGRDKLLVNNGQIPNGLMAQMRASDVKTGVRLIDDRGGLIALLVQDSQKGIKLARVFKPEAQLV